MRRVHVVAPAAVVPLALGVLLFAEACGSPSTPDTLTEPIQVDSVEVEILESTPPQVAARVTGVLGDGCATLHSVEQQRAGNTITVTILRQRPREAICIQIAKLYDAVIRLEGPFSAGSYLLRVNGVERSFRIG